MVEADPPAAFVVIEPELAFKFLVVTLDSPAHLGKVDELADARPRGEVRKPVVNGLGR